MRMLVELETAVETMADCLDLIEEGDHESAWVLFSGISPVALWELHKRGLAREFNDRIVDELVMGGWYGKEIAA